MTSDCGETTNAFADNGKSPATHLRQQLHLQQALKGLHGSKGWLDSQQSHQSHHSQRGASTATAVVQNHDRELDLPPSLKRKDTIASSAPSQDTEKGRGGRELQPKAVHGKSAESPAMIFSDFYRSPRSPLSKLRQHHPQLSTQHSATAPEWVADEYADLLSKDKTKQKDAVKRYLTDKVRNDWTFTWPPTAAEEEDPTHGLGEQVASVTLPNHDILPKQSAESQAVISEEDGYRGEQGTELDGPESDVEQGNAIDDDNDDAESVYSVMSEDATHYRPRTEWTSDLSDDDDLPPKFSPFRHEHRESAQLSVQEIMQAKKARRRRALREEMSWNEGLACFEARRNAWTGAKTVRVRSKPISTPPASPRSPRRFFFRRSISGSPPSPAVAIVSQHGDHCGAVSDSSSVSKEAEKDLRKLRSTDSSASDSTGNRLYPIETLLPMGQPLLPPTNPLRASISPAVYLSLYDKVILHNLQPACPINLSDMLRSCVAGWKRDGEWPPRGSAPDPIPGSRRKKKASTSANDNTGNVARRMSFGLLGRDRDDENGTGKGIRRSLQRALGIGVMGGVGDT